MKKLWTSVFAALLLLAFMLPAQAAINDRIESAQALFLSELAIESPTLIEGTAHESGYFFFVHRDKEGNPIWAEVAFNGLDDEGESSFLDCYLRATNCPSNFYLRLSDASTPCSIAETDALAAASAGEPSTNGYAANLIERSATGWPTLVLDSGDYQATASTETFVASGGPWGPVYCAFIGTTSDNTGKLISHAALSTGRTLAAGESLQVTYKIKQQ